MAETNSTVSGTVLFETGDDLSETNIGASAAQANSVDYVERGCGFSVNHTNETIDIGSTGTRANYAIVENPSSHVAWHLYPDQDTGISLPDTNGTNHVFIAYDESSDVISYHIDDDDSAPSEPSLKIGTVDTANDTSTELNREPDGNFETTTTDGLVVDDTYHWASQYDGADADARLDNTLAAVSSGDIVFLENADYTVARTGTDSIDQGITLVGTEFRVTGTKLTGDWELDNGAIRHVSLDTADLTIGTNVTRHSHLTVNSGDTITVSVGRVLLGVIGGAGTVVFEAGTSGGEIGVKDGNLTVTDNGSNNTLTT